MPAFTLYFSAPVPEAGGYAPTVVALRPRDVPTLIDAWVRGHFPPTDEHSEAAIRRDIALEIGEGFLLSATVPDEEAAIRLIARVMTTDQKEARENLDRARALAGEDLGTPGGTLWLLADPGDRYAVFVGATREDARAAALDDLRDCYADLQGDVAAGRAEPETFEQYVAARPWTNEIAEVTVRDAVSARVLVRALGAAVEILDEVTAPTLPPVQFWMLRVPPYGTILGLGRTAEEARVAAEKDARDTAADTSFDSEDERASCLADDLASVARTPATFHAVADEVAALDVIGNETVSLTGAAEAWRRAFPWTGEGADPVQAHLDAEVAREAAWKAEQHARKSAEREARRQAAEARARAARAALATERAVDPETAARNDAIFDVFNLLRSLPTADVVALAERVRQGGQLAVLTDPVETVKTAVAAAAEVEPADFDDDDFDLGSLDGDGDGDALEAR